MLELKKGINILAEIGGITTLDEAQALFAKKCDQENLAKLKKITNEEALMQIANAIAMMQPDSIFVNTGSEADKLTVRQMSIAKGEEQPLAMKDHTVHFDYEKEQGRVVDKTAYIVNEDEETSVLARKILRNEAYEYVKTEMIYCQRQISADRVFSRGRLRVLLPAMEITTSTYVMHSANLLYRNAHHHFDAEVERAGLRDYQRA